MQRWILPLFLVVVSVLINIAVQLAHGKEKMQGLKNVVVVGGSYVGSVSRRHLLSVDADIELPRYRERPQSWQVPCPLDIE
jgi:hypothetical protein